MTPVRHHRSPPSPPPSSPWPSVTGVVRAERCCLCDRKREKRRRVRQGKGSGSSLFVKHCIVVVLCSAPAAPFLLFPVPRFWLLSDVFHSFHPSVLHPFLPPVTAARTQLHAQRIDQLPPVLSILSAYQMCGSLSRFVLAFERQLCRALGLRTENPVPQTLAPSPDRL